MLPTAAPRRWSCRRRCCRPSPSLIGSSAPTSARDRLRRRTRAAIAGFEDLLAAAAGPDVRHRADHARRLGFWLYSSGSTGTPKGTVHMHANLRARPPSSTARRVLGLARERRRASRRRSCSSPTASATRSPSRCRSARPTVLMAERPTPDAVVRRADASTRPTVFFGAPTLYAALLADARAARSATQLALRVCVSAGEALPRRDRRALDRALRRRHPRRHRLDRDAAHLPLEPARRRPLRHHRQAGAGLRARAASTTTAARSRDGRDRRALDQRADRARSCTGTTARRSRATFQGDWTRTRRQVHRATPTATTSTRGRSDDMLKVERHLRVAVRGRGRADARIRRCSKPRSSAWPTSDELIKPKAFVVLKPGQRRRALARALQAFVQGASSRPTSTRAGSSSSTSCRRPRPARSSASSCGPRAGRADT